MEQLKRIIGEAPSEMIREVLLRRIKEEHRRVSEGIANWSPPSYKRKEKKERITLKKIMEMQERLGVNLEDLLKIKEEGG